MNIALIKKLQIKSKELGIWRLRRLDCNLYECLDVVVAVEDKYFIIESHKVGVGKYGEDLDDFFIKKTSRANAEKNFCRKILSTKEEPLVFVQKENVNDEEYATIRFHLGQRPILLTADLGLVMIGLSHWDIDGYFIEYDNNVLLNGDVDDKEG